MIKQNQQLAIVVLAAGGASRFGAPKQLALYKQKTLIEHSIELLSQLPHPFFVVTGAYHEQIKMRLATAKINTELLFNENWQQGMSSSIALAVKYCQLKYSALMFIAVDQVKLDVEDLTSLIDNWQRSPDFISATHYKNSAGIPAIFPQQYFSQLINLTGDKGAKSIIQSEHEVSVVRIDNAVYDIDSVADLLAF